MRAARLSIVTRAGPASWFAVHEVGPSFRAMRLTLPPGGWERDLVSVGCRVRANIPPPPRFARKPLALLPLVRRQGFSIWVIVAGPFLAANNARDSTAAANAGSQSYFGALSPSPIETVSR